jgi:hypothetical protein
MSTDTPRDPDWHIKIAGAGIVVGLTSAALVISRHWLPGIYAGVVVELLIMGWMLRDVRRDAR